MQFCKNAKGASYDFTKECETATNWVYNNKMILDKSIPDNTNIEVEIENEKIRYSSSAKLLGVHVDDKLNFNSHVNEICKSAGNQSNALIRLKSFLGLKQKEVLVNSFINSNLNYCRLVWMFPNKKSLDKIESLQRKVLRFLLNYYPSSNKQVLEKSSKYYRNIHRLRFLCNETQKHSTS